VKSARDLGRILDGHIYEDRRMCNCAGSGRELPKDLYSLSLEDEPESPTHREAGPLRELPADDHRAKFLRVA